VRRLAVSLLTMIVPLLPLMSSGQGVHDYKSVGDQFLGAWRLLWLEEPDAGGKIHKPDCTGLLVYTRDGHMSVQVMYRDAPVGTNAAPVEYAQGGYEASFGRYEIVDAHTFSFHVEGALVRALIGKDLNRLYELSGKQLIVKSVDPKEHWRVAWEHY
jgi:Lipocalin-like domain